MAEQATEKKEEELKRKVVGVVVSDKMAKTITVRAERLIQHPKFGKFLRRYTKYKAHDEGRTAKVGDKVELVASRPLSKTKHWVLSQILERGEAALAAAAASGPSK